MEFLFWYPYFLYLPYTKTVTVLNGIFMKYFPVTNQCFVANANETNPLKRGV